MTRQQKTPQQRAQEALDVEERRVDKLSKKVMRLEGELAGLRGELDAAKVRRNYLKKHPDLEPTQGSTTSTGGTTR